ncbi:MAG: dipeptide epimerase [Elusimicrobia bacterium]|nr:dipeptide epimerase [Elusimicrobiota bacterium]
MKSPFRIVGGDVAAFTVALKVPFITSAGRKEATTNVGVTLRLQGGARGYGEASGSVVQKHLRPARLALALRREVRRCLGRDARDAARLARAAWVHCAEVSPAAAAFECALLDAATRQMGVPLVEWLGGAASRIETDITLSAAGTGEARAAALRGHDDGFQTFKIKVGTGFAEDLARVEAAWTALKGSTRALRIILDGNQGMTRSSALRLAEACLSRGAPVVLFEQPLPRGKLRDSAALRRASPVLVAADEDVRSREDALRVLEADAADVLNIKVAKTGIAESRDIVALARAGRKRLMIGCMQETARGLEASACLALGTGAFEFVDLDSDHLLVPTQPRGALVREGPWLSLRD